MEFKQDGDTVRVFTGEQSADVYYSINRGSNTSAGLRWNENSGNFKSGSGSTIDFDTAKTIIRSKISG